MSYRYGNEDFLVIENTAPKSFDIFVEPSDVDDVGTFCERTAFGDTKVFHTVGGTNRILKLHSLVDSEKTLLRGYFHP